jgi:hypothetical protein
MTGFRAFETLSRENYPPERFLTHLPRHDQYPLRVNGTGLPMRSDITPGQTSDYLGFDLVVDASLPEPCVLLADRGNGSGNLRKTMAARNAVPVIPMRKPPKLRVAAAGQTASRDGQFFPTSRHGEAMNLTSAK